MLEIFTQSSEKEPKTIYVLSEESLDGWKKDQSPLVNEWLNTNRFTAASGEVLVVPDAAGGAQCVLVGTGAGRDPFAPGAVANKLPEGVWCFDPSLPEEDLKRAVLAYALQAYQFRRYKDEINQKARLFLADEAHTQEAHLIAEGVFLARDLVNTPPNDMGPEELEDAAVALATHHEAGVHIIRDVDLLSQNFPLIYTVGQASDRRPRLIDLVWGRSDAPKITLVGKGVCFDSGGLDLKPSSAMALMKKDMGGAANVLGLASMIMAAKLDIRLRVLVPAVENSVSGNAFRTSDIYNSRKGLTVEIGNTDAEGRLILADALALADEEKPDLLLDLATLTGAARSALGPDIPPFYTTDDFLADEIAKASEAVFDPVWRMPLPPTYDRWLDSPNANLSSTGSLPMAGSITAALFLKRFVTETPSYAHFDIYAWANRTRPGKPLGGEAHAIRALFELLKQRYGTGANQ